MGSLFGRKSTLPKRMTREDYVSLDLDERAQLLDDFYAYLKEKFGKSDFGYESFPKLDYDRRVLNILIEELKRDGKLEGSEYFRLT